MSNTLPHSIYMSIVALMPILLHTGDKSRWVAEAAAALCISDSCMQSVQLRQVLEPRFLPLKPFARGAKHDCVGSTIRCAEFHGAHIPSGEKESTYSVRRKTSNRRRRTFKRRTWRCKPLISDWKRCSANRSRTSHAVI